LKKPLLVALTSLTILSTAVARADEASHRKAAIKLIEVADTRTMLDRVMIAIDQMVAQQLASLDLPPEGRKEAQTLQKEIMAWFSDSFPWVQMRLIYADIYIDVFTEAELNELTEFYKTPLGQKMLKKMPELIEKTMQKTQRLLADKMPAFQKKLQQTVSDLEEKYEKRNDPTK